MCVCTLHGPASFLFGCFFSFSATRMTWQSVTSVRQAGWSCTDNTTRRSTHISSTVFLSQTQPTRHTELHAGLFKLQILKKRISCVDHGGNELIHILQVPWCQNGFDDHQTLMNEQTLAVKPFNPILLQIEFVCKYSATHIYNLCQRSNPNVGSAVKLIRTSSWNACLKQRS